LNYQTEAEGHSKVAVIIKAAPDIGRKHGETVCVAGIDYDGLWHRLYPVPFKDLNPAQRFKRWDVIEFDWIKPTDDDRVESKRIFSQTLTVVGSVPERERHAFARRALVSDLDEQLALNRSFALIRPEVPKFSIVKMSDEETDRERKEREVLHTQLDMFSKPLVEKDPPPYRFRYNFRFGGKDREYNCIDWETEATFFKWKQKYGEEETLELMQKKFGEELPKKGVVFAMGTHRVKIFKNWLLSGILRVDEEKQGSFI
jgi:hypothetical protein